RGTAPVPPAGDERAAVDLAGRVDMAARALGPAGAEAADIFTAVRLLQRAEPVHQAGLPRAFIEQAGIVEIDAPALDPSVTQRAAIFREDRRSVVGRLSPDAPDQLAGSVDSAGPAGGGTVG